MGQRPTPDNYGKIKQYKPVKKFTRTGNMFYILGNKQADKGTVDRETITAIIKQSRNNVQQFYFDHEEYIDCSLGTFYRAMSGYQIKSYIVKSIEQAAISLGLMNQNNESIKSVASPLVNELLEVVETFLENTSLENLAKMQEWVRAKGHQLKYALK